MSPKWCRVGEIHNINLPALSHFELYVFNEAPVEPTRSPGPALKVALKLRRDRAVHQQGFV